MVATFARLKLRLLRGGGKRVAKLGFAIGLLLGSLGIVAVWQMLAVASGRPGWSTPAAVIAAAGLVIAWFVGPLVLGMTDSTVDPSRLAHLPLTPRQLVTGLFTSAVIGVLPLVSLVGVAGFLFLTDSWTTSVFALVAGAVLWVMCIVAARVGAIALSTMLRGRRSKDVAAFVLALLAMLGGLAFQGLAEVVEALTLDQAEAAASVLRFTPGGWVGQSVGWAIEGRWVIAVVALAVSCLAVVALTALWWRLLQQMLTSPDREGTRDVRSANFVPKVARLFPSPALQAAMARNFRLIRRDPRMWAGLASQLPLLVVIALPARDWFVEGDPRAVLLAGGIGSYGAMINANMFGIDGRSSWIDLLSARSMRVVLAGKTLSFGMIILPVATTISVVIAAMTGGWNFLIPAIGSATGGYFAAAGALALASVRYPVAMPEQANIFGGTAGVGVKRNVMLLFSLVGGLIVGIPPVLVVATLSLRSATWGLVAVPFVLVYGLLMWRVCIDKGARTIDSDNAGFLQLVTATT